MNSYSDYYGVETPGRRARMQDNVVIGDAIGSMVAATVFGLIRVIEELDSAERGEARAGVRDGHVFGRRDVLR